MAHFREIQTACVLAAVESDDLELRDLRALLDPRVRRVVLSKFRAWRRQKESEGHVLAVRPNVDRPLRGLCRVFPFLDTDFIKWFIEFLIEHADEIIAIIETIIGLFGESSLSALEIEDKVLEHCLAAVHEIELDDVDDDLGDPFSLSDIISKFLS